MLPGISTLYDILGVEPDAPPEKIQAIFRLRSRSAYPHRPGEGNSELQQQINEAYRILRNPELRTAYNSQMGLPLKPRSLHPGKAIYSEIRIKNIPDSQAVLYTLTRQEPCPRCWREGCPRCMKKGTIQKDVSLNIEIPPFISEILIEGEGMQSEPGGKHGDLIIYIIRT